jgi:hypothetical protein
MEQTGSAREPHAMVVPAPPFPGCLLIASLPVTPAEGDDEKVSCKPWSGALDALDLAAPGRTSIEDTRSRMPA